MEQENRVSQKIAAKISVDTVLFFDMDGTLIDTNLANFLSYKKAIFSVTKSDHDLFYNPDKRINRGNLNKAVPNLSKTEYKRIINKKEEYYISFLHETKLNPVIADILFKYSKTNKIVLVTNCRKRRALITLNYFGIAEKFSNIYYRQFNQKINKFQNAISKLGVPPNLVVAFENEEIEIIKAKQAGIETINLTII